MKVKDRIEMIRAIAPKQSTKGQLYRHGDELKGRWRKITVYALLVSSENTHMVRETVIEREPSKAKSAAEWKQWLDRNIQKVYSSGVLPGVGLRTGKLWSVQKWIGWRRNDLPQS